MWSREPGSFRDAGGFVFSQGGVLYRQVNLVAARDYDLLMQSDLYSSLTAQGLLLKHEEVPLRLVAAQPAHRVLRPERVPFISYPYEWCFGQLRDAALITLKIQRLALAHGAVLRDASAYNIQFIGTRPVFIDTLSFGQYYEGQPWVAYRQFCEHFLAPLALMALVDPSLGQLLRVHIDGIPLPLASRMLPSTSLARFGLLTHVHLHARSMRRAASADADSSFRDGSLRGRVLRGRHGMGLIAMLGLVDSLQSAVRGLVCQPANSAWADYYECTNYSENAYKGKTRLVREFLSKAASRRRLRVIWDLGANTGAFSKVGAETDSLVVALDGDHAAVERHYRDCVARREDRILPLVQDFANPSAGIGWSHEERHSLLDRGPADLAMALALVHHIAIGNNVPLPDVVAFLRRVAPCAIVEFVPKVDSQVQRLLATREDVFDGYSRNHFEQAVVGHFAIVDREAIPESSRTLYLLDAER